MAAPTTMIEDPEKMVFRRPNGLPMNIQATAPKKHPTLYAATEIPDSVLATRQSHSSIQNEHLG